MDDDGSRGTPAHLHRRPTPDNQAPVTMRFARDLVEGNTEWSEPMRIRFVLNDEGVWRLEMKLVSRTPQV